MNKPYMRGKTIARNSKHLKTKQTTLTRKQTKQLTRDQIELHMGDTHRNQQQKRTALGLQRMKQTIRNKHTPKPSLPPRDRTQNIKIWES